MTRLEPASSVGTVASLPASSPMSAARMELENDVFCASASRRCRWDSFW